MYVRACVRACVRAQCVNQGLFNVCVCFHVILYTCVHGFLGFTPFTSSAYISVLGGSHCAEKDLVQASVETRKRQGHCWSSSRAMVLRRALSTRLVYTKADFGWPTWVSPVTLTWYQVYGNFHCARSTPRVIQLNCDDRDHGDNN